MDSQTLAVTDSRLLALAPELLCTIFDSLNDETLPVLRLTCKTLDIISFDRFAKAFLNRRACYVYGPDRWLLLSRLLNGSARLASRIDELVFTDSMLEFKWFKDISTAMTETAFVKQRGKFAQVNEHRVMEYAAVHTEENARILGYSTFPSPSLVNRVMMEISKKVPRAHICFDLTDSPSAEHRGNHVHDSILSAAASSQVAITTLLLNSASLHALKDPIHHLGEHFLRCISPLRHLKFECRGIESRRPLLLTGEQRLMILDTIIKNASDLSWLELELSDQELDPMPLLEAEHMSATLLSNDLCNLRILDLHGMTFHSRDLVQALSRCTLLEKLVLGWIRLQETWLGPLRQMLAQPKLSCIQIQELRSADGAEDGKYLLLKFDGLEHWPKWGDEDGWGEHGICIDDRAVVQASLRELLSRPLLYDLDWGDR